MKRPAWRSLLLALLRAAVTVGLLGQLVSRLDPVRAQAMLAQVSVPWLLAALAALLATVPASALRWRLILAGEGASPDVASLVKLLFVGLFFNQLLPTGIGGDAVRAWRCRKLGIGLPAAVRSVVLDRLSGYLVMILAFAAGLPELLPILPDAREGAAMIGLLAAALAGLVALGLIGRLPPRWLRFPILGLLAAVPRDARRLVADPTRCVPVAGLSALTVGLTVLAFLLVGESLGLALSFSTWLLAVPPVGLLQLLPVSLAGWGVREIGLVVILGAFGIPAEPALATSVVLGLCLILVALPGGVIWLADWDLPASAAAADLA